MNMVLMLVMLALSMLIVVMYGLGEALTVGAILRHVGNIVVLSLASYSISVLAGQLTGTVLTHLAIMLLLHFCVLVAMLIMSYIGDIFFATFSMSYPPIALYFSPICAMTVLLTEYSTQYLMYMTAPAMSSDAQVKQHVYALLEPVIEDGLYRTSQFDDYQRSYYESGEDYSSLHVTYILNSGREVTRQNINNDSTQIKKAVTKIS